MRSRAVRVFGSPDEATDRIRAQQVDLLFKNVGPGVTAAGVAAVALEFILWRLHAVDPATGWLWLAYLLPCVAAHLGLLHLYRISTFIESKWRRWALAFTIVSFFEGVGWGWASVYLESGGRPDAHLLVVFLTLIVAVGAALAFGSYLPAFFALFVPAILPCSAMAIVSSEEIIAATTFLMPIFTVVVPWMAIQASRKFDELVTLRLKSAELAESLRSQIELVEQAMIAKANFLAAASHDLRQPVHAIGLFAGALRELSLTEPARKLTGQIESSVVALDGLFAALLDISRLDARSVEVRRSPVAIGPLIVRICQDFAADAAAKAVELRSVACSLKVHTDPILLERVLRNLVSNAVRYTLAGRVLVGCRRRGATLEIQVCDTGLGIAPEHRDLIFKEYFQLHNPERDRQKGLGLGLAIVQRLVDLIDCRLSLKSEVGRGSRFNLCVPLAVVGPPHAPVEREAPAAGRESGLIAVVDDEAPILSGMTTLLQGWGYTVVGGGCSADVVAELAHCPLRPDLIITDHWLRRGETGFDVIERLRGEYNEEIPAILISGDTGPQLRAEAQAIGAVLMHKPTPNGKLRAAISHTMASGRLEAGKSRGL